MRPDPRLGTDVGPYRIERVLGRGGMGVVYLAEQPSLGRKVALKVIAPEFSDEPRTKARFLRESQMAAAIDHPNILPIHEAGELDGVLFIAMRYVEGEDLARRLAREPISPRASVAILAQVAAALDAAHVRGLIHRDVKPANILLDAHAGPDGADHAYLTDFGLTKRGGSEGSLTGVGGFAGTLAYIAPEQVEGRDVDGRADQYSLACMAFECLSGRVPFVRDTDVAVAMAHLRDPVPSAVELRPDLPSAVDVVLARGMAKDREGRYATCAAFVADLRNAVDPSATRPTIPGAKARRRSSIPRAAAIGASMVVIVAAAAFVLGGGAGSASVPTTGPTSAASRIAHLPSSTPTSPSEPSEPSAPETPHTLPAGRYVNDQFDPPFSVQLGDGWYLHSSYVDAVHFQRVENEDEAIDIVRFQVVYPAGCFSTDVARVDPVLLGRTSDDVVKWIQSHPDLEVGSAYPVNVAGVSGLTIDAEIVRGPGKACGNEDDPNGDYVQLAPIGGYAGTGGDLLGAWKGSKLRFIIFEVGGRATTIMIHAPGETFDSFIPKANEVITSFLLGGSRTSPASSTETPTATLISQPGTFSPTGKLIEARFAHSATLLQTGQVLIAGGQGIKSGASAELYDPTSGTFTATGAMKVARVGHTATRLPDGRVLLVGGSSSSGDFFASAELYDPTSGSFAATGAMEAARVGHTATLLTDGRILIAGGSGVAGGFFASAELYDPAAGTFTTTGPLSTARGGHSATLLPDGRVLIAGGNDASDVLASAELYDPTSGTFTPTGAMKVARVGHTATLLPARVVLIAGGGIEDALDSAEIYDPASGTFIPVGLLTVPRSGHAATMLPNGWVLLAGGWTGNALDTNYLTSAELFDPTKGFGPTGAMTEARLMPAATLLPNGSVLITGGLNVEGAIPLAELFEAPLAP